MKNSAGSTAKERSVGMQEPPKKKGFLDRLFGKSKPKSDAKPKKPPQTRPAQSEMSEFDA